MNDIGTLNLMECDLTNNDIVVTYVPSTFVTNYKYQILKDDKEYKSINVSNNSNSDIKLSETGNYKIIITAYSNNSYKVFETGIYRIDKEAPVIEVNQSSIDIILGEYYNEKNGVKATDNVDGNITSNIKTNIDDINLNTLGKKRLIYTVSDKAGNTATKEVLINVSITDYLLSISQIAIIFVLVAFFIFLLILNKITKLEKRFGKYTISPLRDHSKSALDNFINYIRNLSSRISNRIDSFDIFRKASKRYQKYVDAFSGGRYNSMDFISMKILTSFLFLIVSIVIETIRFNVLSIYELVIPMIIGYFLLDIIFAYRYYRYRKKIEKDLLQAIIIMNNCFKSGRSITQAINIVAEQLEGAIADEFKKMSLELSFGLEIEVVFDRFAKRIKLEEAAYLTSSLSVLNKTGGNIIKVFTSIEKTLFNRQKLNLELKSLTGSSKIIMYALTLMPILFILVINFINKDYFAPLFTSAIGFIIMGVILILYITYIIIVRKIMKVRM